MARQTFERNSIYKDFDLSFTRNPLTNDIGTRTDANAISQSVATLISTDYYERPFQPEIGSNIKALLFELADPITIADIRRAISETLLNYEPRITVDNIVVEDRQDINSYSVVIYYRIVATGEAVETPVVLERLR